MVKTELQEEMTVDELIEFLYTKTKNDMPLLNKVLKDTIEISIKLTITKLLKGTLTY